MITLISASVLTFIITIALTAFTISTCQRIFAKKFRSNFTGICSENGCNADLGTDLCRSTTVMPATVPLGTAALLIPSPTANVNISNHSGLANHLNGLSTAGSTVQCSATLNNVNLNNVNTLNDQANYAGPISNCSSTSTDQCTIDTNSTMITNLSDTSNSTGPPANFANYGYSFSPNLNSSLSQTNFQSNLTTANNLQASSGISAASTGQPASSLNRLTNALASITNMLTSGGAQRNQTETSNNSLFHISGNDQLTDMIISQPPPPAYEQSYPTGELPRLDLQEGYTLQLPSSYYNELCT